MRATKYIPNYSKAYKPLKTEDGHIFKTKGMTIFYIFLLFIKCKITFKYCRMTKASPIAVTPISFKMSPVKFFTLLTWILDQ